MLVAETVIEPGDKILLSSSGVVSLPSGGGEVLGEARFVNLVKREAQHDVDTMMTRVGATLRKFHGAESLGPDVTLLTLERTA